MGFAAKDDPVAKGPVTRCLDALSVGTDARRRLTELRQALIGLQPEFRGLEEVFATHVLQGYYGPDEVRALVEYLKTYWFSEDTGWWPHFQPVARPYALGLIQTLNLSLAPKGDPLPIDSYWLIGHDHVALINLASARQVTLLIATPKPGQGTPPGIQGAESEAWVTTRRAGRTPNEINPVTHDLAPGGPEPRVRTFRIQTQPPRSGA